MIILFWSLISLILYAYFFYPLFLALAAAIWRRGPMEKAAFPEEWPSVSVVLSVWNEADVIKNKIDNLLSLDYPADKLDILIGSDGSTDGTNEIIRAFGSDRVHLLASQERRGKMSVLNRLVGEARGDILIFTDARQIFEPDAAKALVAAFQDPQVGCVSGELVFSHKEGGTARGVNLYWNYEKFMRQRESRLHSMLGATGAIYAVRKELYTPIPEKVVLDDVFVPLHIVLKGYRAIFEGEAKAYDDVADSPREEARRKARTLFGNYQIFAVFPGIFNPFRSPVAVQMISHKLLRVLVPFFLIVIFVLNLFLLADPLYRIIFVLQIIFYGMAFLGGLTRYAGAGLPNLIKKICFVPYVFCLLNFSALVGFIRFAGSKQDVTWEKARGVE